MRIECVRMVFTPVGIDLLVTVMKCVWSETYYTTVYYQLEQFLGMRYYVSKICPGNNYRHNYQSCTINNYKGSIPTNGKNIESTQSDRLCDALTCNKTSKIGDTWIEIVERDQLCDNFET